MVSLLLNAAVAALGRFTGGVLTEHHLLWTIVEFLVSSVVITLLFAMIFKFLPDISIAWSDVWMGSFVTAMLFNLGKFLIGYYLGRSSMVSIYGAAGSFIILLLWVYYSAQLFFFGAEFTKVYTEKFGSRLDAKLKVHPPSPETVIVDPTTGLPAGKGNDEASVTWT